MSVYRDILKKYWGYDDFRGIQCEIIESIGAGKDTLGLMPTGGGKSITFQVPAMSMEGVCLVITPLISLMKDQVDKLRRHDIVAAMIDSSMMRGEITRNLDNCIYGNTKFLYVSPERINSTTFQQKLKRINISFITVDEAHCISQWGYDFRPAYLNISQLRKLKPEAPILALTATATQQVVDDIQDKLEFRERNVFRMSFERKNIAYVVRHTDNKLKELIHILSNVKGRAIVYARNRKRTKEYAQGLEKVGISATYYHAGLYQSIRNKNQDLWNKQEKRVIVATNAFGMGIDRADVRLVVHIDTPNAIEEYFQEAGRAGRDGKKAYAVLLYDKSDTTTLKRRLSETFPPRETIAHVYECLAYFFEVGLGSGMGHTFMLDIERFCITYKFNPLQAESALHLLTQAGYIDYHPEESANTFVKFLIGRDDLYLLKSLSPTDDNVITNLLRLYTGVFADYVRIDLSLIAEHAGLEPQMVYLSLKSLSQRHIIHFIPRRKEPYFKYLTKRVPQEDIIINHKIYDERKLQFEQHIKSMIAYATTDNVCRSRLLLHYFGETNAKDCGQCDVCLNTTLDDINRTAALIEYTLSDGLMHEAEELFSLGVSKERILEAIDLLSMEERIKTNDTKISLIQ